MLIEPESLSQLPTDKRSWPPPLSARQGLKAGDRARIIVLVNGTAYAYPWVDIVEVGTSGYRGLTTDRGRDATDGTIIDLGTPVTFTADSIIEI